MESVGTERRESMGETLPLAKKVPLESNDSGSMNKGLFYSSEGSSSSEEFSPIKSDASETLCVEARGYLKLEGFNFPICSHSLSPGTMPEHVTSQPLVTCNSCQKGRHVHYKYLEDMHYLDNVIDKKLLLIRIYVKIIDWNSSN